MSNEIPNRLEIEYLLDQLNSRRKDYRRGKGNQIHHMRNGLQLLNEYSQRDNILSDEQWSTLSKNNRSYEIAGIYSDWVRILKKSVRNPPKKTSKGGELAGKYDILSSVLRESQLFERDLAELSDLRWKK